MATSTWDGVYLRLRHELEGEIRAAQIAADFGADFDSFEASLDSLVRQYASKGIAALVKNKIAPHFDQLKSFEKAVAAVTSNNMTAGFVWAGVQAILEVSISYPPLQAKFNWTFSVYMPLFDSH